MRGFFQIVSLLCAVACASVAPKTHAQGTAPLDAAWDLKVPVGMPVAEFEKKMPNLMAKAERSALKAGGEFIRLITSKDAGKFHFLDAKFGVSSCTVNIQADRVWSISLSLQTEQKMVADAVQALYAQAPGKSGMRDAGSQDTIPILVWKLPTFSVHLFSRQPGVSFLSFVSQRGTPSAPVAAVEVPKQDLKVEADLDYLLSTSELWQCDTKTFESRYRPKTETEQKEPPQFEWLNAAKDRARFSRNMYADLETKLTMFGRSMPVEEATVEFVGGRVARATISFYNRGDSGEITAQQFDGMFRKIGQNLGQVFKVSPKSQLMSANAAVKTVGWNWTTPMGIALLEYNEYGGSIKPEFLRLKLAAPNQADWSMGRLAVGVQRMALTKNITRTGSGDVYIAGVPMVDQGAKGYCVAASCQRLFEYMQIPCDQHEMAQLLKVDVEKGTDAFEMQKSLAKVDGQFRVSFKPLVNPTLYYDNKGKRRVSLKEFAGIIKEHTDKGVPLLWALGIGAFKEEPPLPGDGQVSGGHMRLVIGYNSSTNKILFTDSWGAGHELKRMDASDAYQATLGLYSMSPRGL
jgi:hypothetical protein